MRRWTWTGETVRGLREERYAGDGSAYGNAELRVRLGRFFALLPGDYGVFGLADVGRVFLEGESSDVWHTGVGGGFWFAFLDPANTIRTPVTALRSAEALNGFGDTRAGRPFGLGARRRRQLPTVAGTACPRPPTAQARAIVPPPPAAEEETVWTG